MRHRLPPLFTLQSFEAAARLGSFTRAAAELKLTPGAISRQVRQLEDWCGFTLFERHGPRTSVTREGVDLLARLGGPLSALHEAVYPPPDDAVQTLRVSTLASIARAWLLPRLADFTRRHPNIALVIETDYALMRPPPRTAMVLLRHGLAPGGDLRSELLFDDRLIAVATPARARELGSDASRWPPDAWLRHVSQDTRGWADTAGLPPGHEMRGLAFNDADVVLDAAQQGLGVAVARLSVAWPRLASRQLVLACAAVCPSPRSNLLVLREDSAELPAVRCFATWLREQAAAWRAVQAEFDRPDHAWRRVAGRRSRSA